MTSWRERSLAAAAAGKELAAGGGGRTQEDHLRGDVESNISGGDHSNVWCQQF